MQNRESRLAWEDLRLMLSLLAGGSLKAAARDLGLDYSTVWRQVQRLEAISGGRLFVRLRGRVQPTALGQQLALRAREIEHLLASAQALGKGRVHAAGELRLATADMLLSPIVLPIIGRLRQEAPDLRVSLEVAPGTRDVGRLEVDAAIRTVEAANDSVTAVALGKLGFGAYAMPELARQHLDKPMDTWPLLTAAQRWSQFITMRWLAAHVPAALSVGEFDTMMSIVEATEAGLGIALLPHSLAHRTGRLVELPLKTPVPPLRLLLQYHPDMRADARIRALVQAARTETQKRAQLLEHGSVAPPQRLRRPPIQP